MPLPTAIGIAPPTNIGPTLIDANWLLSAPTFKNAVLTGLLYESAAAGIVAGTTRTQSGATPLALEVNRVDTSTAPAAGTLLGDGVALPVATAGLDICVINNTANIIVVYPNGTDQINNSGAGIGIPIPPADVAQFESAAAGAWHFEAGVGVAGALNTVLSVDTIVALGTNQATATPLPADLNRITTVAVGTGVVLPAAKAGLDLIVCNHGLNTLLVYSNGADTIDDLTSVSQMTFSTVIYSCYTNGAWYTEGLGSGFASIAGGAISTVTSIDALTANAGATQGTGTPITAAIAGFSTVAGAGNSGTLPVSKTGMVITVINETGTSMNVFPAVGEKINVLAANAAIAVTNAAPTVFYCMTPGFWWTK